MPARAAAPPAPSSGDPLIELQRLGEHYLGMSAAGREHYIEALPTHKRRTLEYALGVCNAHWRADPSTWLSKMDMHYTRYRYSALLGAAYRRAADGVEPRQIWVLPARLGKSRLGSQGGPGWELDRSPTDQIILASYGKDLAVENAIGVRDLLTSRPDLTRCRLRQDRKRQDRFLTTEGGGILAAGIGSRMTGFGAGGGLIGAGGGIVLDDLFRDWAEAHSAAARERVWNWFLAVVTLRLNAPVDPSRPPFIIHVTTRWHMDDAVGRMLAAGATGEGDVWSVYRLPALAEAPSAEYPEPDLLGRAPGEPIEVMRFSRDQVLARHRVLGSYLVAGMEQGRPAPEEGGELKRAWWQWGDLPTGGHPDDAISSWDMKLKETKSGDFQVGQVWHRYASTAWLIDSVRGQFNVPTIRAAIALLAVRHPEVRKHLIENTGNGPEIIAALRRGIERATLDDETCGELGIGDRDEREKVEQMLRRGIPGIIPVIPQGDKVTRARACSGYLEAGDVWIARRGGKAPDYGTSLVNEAAAFPNNGEHDDQVDSWSQAIKYLLATGQAVVTRPKRDRITLPAPGAIGPRRPVR